MRKEEHLFLCASGGAMMGDIQIISLDFIKDQKIEIDGARELIVRIVYNFLTLVNSATEITPYLRDCPFTANNVEFSVSFEKNEQQYYQNGAISYVLAAKGKVSYFRYDPFEDRIDLILVETYEEALEKVQRSKRYHSQE